MIETSQVSFKVSTQDADLIRKIVNRAWKNTVVKNNTDKMSLTMDITAAHANGNPLRLADLLGADDFNFSHDVYGIMRHINRDTGQLDDYFSPRFSGRASVGAAK